MSKKQSRRIIRVPVTGPVAEVLQAIANSGFGPTTIEGAAEEMIRNGLNAIRPDGLLGRVLESDRNVIASQRKFRQPQ